MGRAERGRGAQCLVARCLIMDPKPPRLFPLLIMLFVVVAAIVYFYTRS